MWKRRRRCGIELPYSLALVEAASGLVRGSLRGKTFRPEGLPADRGP